MEYKKTYETYDNIQAPTSSGRELNDVTMWSAAVAMPTSAAVFSGLAMAASSMSQPPILEPTIIYK